MSNVALLDTSTVIAILRRDPRALPAATAYLLEHSFFRFSIITRYEALRGYYLFNSTQQHAQFLRLCKDSENIPLNEAILDQAARIYANLYRQGQLIDDADILIAATVLVNKWRIITDNKRHLRRIPGLLVENWLLPQP